MFCSVYRRGKVLTSELECKAIDLSSTLRSQT